MTFIPRRSALALTNIMPRATTIFLTLSRPKEAIDAYYKELAWGGAEQLTKERIAVLYRRQHGSLRGREDAERESVNALALQLSAKDSALFADVDEDLGRFDVLDEKGDPTHLKSYVGKIVIIDFSATWCGQCLMTMNEADTLQKRFPSDIIVIAPDQDDEITRSKAKPFLQKMGYNFVLVYDDAKRRQIKLPYIPSRLVLDRNGRLRFLEFGAPPEGGALLERKVNSLIGP